MTKNKEDFEIALLTNIELKLLISTPPKECSRCDWIINHCLFKNKEGYWINTEELDDSDMKHIEQILGRKLIDGITDMIMVNGRYTSNQF